MGTARIICVHDNKPVVFWSVCAAAIADPCSGADATARERAGRSIARLRTK